MHACTLYNLWVYCIKQNMLKSIFHYVEYNTIRVFIIYSDKKHLLPVSKNYFDRLEMNYLKMLNKDVSGD